MLFFVRHLYEVLNITFDILIIFKKYPIITFLQLTFMNFNYGTPNNSYGK